MDARGESTQLADVLSVAVRNLIERGWQRARRAHAHLGLSQEDFTSDVVELSRRSRRRLGLVFDEAALREDAAGLHYEDLYLARLCERGDERAWSAFVERYQPDLRRVLLRECDASEAESVAADVVTEMALAPTKGTVRTRLGNYEGTGPLWAWLATIGLRTVRRRWRRRREVGLEAAPEQVARRDRPALDASDDVRQLADALRTAWTQLEDPERLALTWKHRDGLAQRVIAKLLGVSEPTVSRLVSRGVTKLQGVVHAIPDLSERLDSALWTRLEQALSAILERSVAPHPPEAD